MKKCLCLVFLMILIPSYCSAAFEFNPKSGVKQIKDFSNDLNLQAELSSELEQGLLKLNRNNDRNAYTIDNNFDIPTLLDGQSTFGDNQLSNIDINYHDNNNINHLSSVSSNLNNNDINGNNAIGETKTQRKCTAMSKMEEMSNCNEDEIKNFVGTNLFDSCRKKCFSAEDIALLAARKDFELLIPKDLPQVLLTDSMVAVLMRYFYNGNKIIQRMTNDESSKRLVEKAYYDMLGGYMKYYIVPVTKYSFYAGQVNIKTVETVLQLYQQCKSFLNTNGNGWKASIANVQDELQSCNIEPLHIGQGNCGGGEEASACVYLSLASNSNDAEDDQMIVCLPKLEPEDCDGHLSNIWLPFKKKHTFNLRSAKSANVLMKFYETVSQCYRFQSLSQATFDKRFKAWILENIQVHLSDEQFYPGLGGILRIYENLRRGKKAIVFELDNKEAEDGTDEEESVADAEDDDDTSRIAKSSELKQFENQAKELENEWFDEPQAEKRKRNQHDDCTGGTSEEGVDKELNASEDGVEANAEEKDPCTVAPIKVKCKPKKKPKCKPIPGLPQPGVPHSHTKPKTKPHTKPHKPPSHSKPKIHGSKSFSLKSLWPGEFFEKVWELFKKYFKYLLYLIALLLLLLLLLFLVTWYRKRPRSEEKPSKPKPTPHSKKQPSGGPQAKPKKKCFNWCACFRKKKKPADEEIVLRADSKSVISTKGYKPFLNTSSSSLLCEPTRKCVPFMKKVRGSETSKGYSSSDGEKGKTKKTKQKVVTIDEKKNKGSPRRKCCLKKSKPESNVKSNNAKGILKSNDGQSPSSSWETMSSILKCSGKGSPAAAETSSIDYTSDEDRCNKKQKDQPKASPRSMLGFLSKKQPKTDDDFCKWKRYGLQPSTAPRDPSSSTTYTDVRSVDHMEKMRRFGMQRSEMPTDKGSDEVLPKAEKSKKTKASSPSPKSKAPEKKPEKSSPSKKVRMPSFFKRSPRLQKTPGSTECIPPLTSHAPEHLKRFGIQRSAKPDN